MKIKIKNKIQIAAGIAKAKIFSRKTPIIVSWAATYRCNQACRYCRIPKLKAKELTTLEARTMISRLAALGVKMINLTGGEALLREDLPELISHMKKNNLYVCLNSNGILIPGVVDQLKHLDLLNLSLEGSQSVHDAIRGQGAYLSVIKAIEAGLAAGIEVDLTATLNRENIGKIDAVLELSHAFKVKVSFQIVEPHVLGENSENPLKISPEEARGAMQKLIYYKKSSKYAKTIKNSLGLLKYLLDWPDLGALDCASGNVVFRVTPEGKLFPCAKSSYEDLPISAYSVDLVSKGTEQIQAELEAFRYPRRNCQCVCTNRLLANLAWNLKI